MINHLRSIPFFSYVYHLVYQNNDTDDNTNINVEHLYDLNDDLENVTINPIKTQSNKLGIFGESCTIEQYDLIDLKDCGLFYNLASKQFDINMYIYFRSHFCNLLKSDQLDLVKLYLSIETINCSVNKISAKISYQKTICEIIFTSLFFITIVLELLTVNHIKYFIIIASIINYLIIKYFASLIDHSFNLNHLINKLGELKKQIITLMLEKQTNHDLIVQQSNIVEFKLKTITSNEYIADILNLDTYIGQLTNNNKQSINIIVTNLKKQLNELIINVYSL